MNKTRRWIKRFGSFLLLLKDILVLAGPHRPLLYFAAVFGFVVSLTDGLLTALAVDFIALITKSEPQGILIISWFIDLLPSDLPLPRDAVGLALLLLAGLLRIVVSGTAESLYAIVSMRVVTYARLAILDKILGARFSYLDRVQTGWIREVVSSNVQGLIRVLQSLMKLNAAAVTAVVFLLLLVNMSTRFSVLLGIFFLCFLPIKLVLAGWIHRFASVSATKRLDFMQHINETLVGIRQVKLQNRRNQFRSMAGSLSASAERAEMNALLVTTWEPLLIQALIILLIAGLLVYSRLEQTGMTLLVGYLLVVYRLAAPVMDVSLQFNGLLKKLPQIGYAASFFRLAPSDLEDSQKTRMDSATIDRIKFEHVNLSYDGRSSVLRGVSFEVKRGQFVAIVGPSGTGKTSLVHLMLKMYVPGAGRILFNEQDIRSVDANSIRDLVGLVSQDVHLFNLSIRDLIRGDRTDLDEDHIVAAARAAHAEGFIRNLPEGFDTVVGERGVLLSGGQRQRLFIAQILARDTSVVIFDEATSAVDITTEENILRDLRRLCADRILIVITHRLEMVRDSDEIHVMEGGQIVETGTWEALMARRGSFWKLHGHQAKAPVSDSELASFG